MTASLWAAAAGALAILLNGLMGWLQRNQAQATGGQLQAAAVSQASIAVVAAVAQAEADAPTTKQSALDRLRAGDV